MTHSQFLAFVTETRSHPAIEAVIKAHDWPESALHHGGIEEAIAFLKTTKSPEFLSVEVASSDEATDALDKLADVCAPHTKVVVTSNVDEFRFYSWLKDIGIYEYLLHPITEEGLNHILSWQESPAERSANADEHVKTPKTIAFIGTRGGVGATTLLSNVAHVLSAERGVKTAILDMDMHFGSVAMNYNVDGGNGLGELFANPDRIDALFLDRVTMKHSDYLTILSSESPMVYEPNGDVMKALPAILKELNAAHDVTLIDVPRAMTKATRSILELADHIVVVTDLSPLGLRDSIRLRDIVVDEMKRPEPMVVASRVGLAPKHEVKSSEFSKFYGQNVAVNVPYVEDAYAAAATGDMLYDMTEDASFKAQINMLVDHFTDAETLEVAPQKFLSRLLKGKK